MSIQCKKGTRYWRVCCLQLLFQLPDYSSNSKNSTDSTTLLSICGINRRRGSANFTPKEMFHPFTQSQTPFMNNSKQSFRSSVCSHQSEPVVASTFGKKRDSRIVTRQRNCLLFASETQPFFKVPPSLVGPFSEVSSISTEFYNLNLSDGNETGGRKTVRQQDAFKRACLDTRTWLFNQSEVVHLWNKVHK